MEAAVGVFPQEVLSHMVHWLDVFRAEWFQEIPRTIHSSALDEAGTPEWSSEFSKWLLRTETREERQGKRNPDGRLRLTKAMRTLRDHSPRAYEVFYRVLVLNDSIESTTRWLNARAIRGGHPERYRNGDTLAIVQAACHWVEQNY